MAISGSCEGYTRYQEPATKTLGSRKEALIHRLYDQIDNLWVRWPTPDYTALDYCVNMITKLESR